MKKITIESELDLFEKTGNSSHARWIANQLLDAKKSGCISGSVDSLLEMDRSFFDSEFTLLSHKINILRGTNKIKLEEVADAIGTSKEWVYGVEKGQINPTLDQVKLLSEFFGVVLRQDTETDIVCYRVSQALSFLGFTKYHIDLSTHAGEHISHFIEMAETHLNKLAETVGPNVKE